MAHFAKLDKNNKVVFVTVGRDQDTDSQLFKRTGDVYKKTSYNTRQGIHYNSETNEPSTDQSKALRKNYAGIGFTYDEAKDAFIPPQPYPSWELNAETCVWEAPVPYPDNGNIHNWNEESQTWTEILDA